MLIRALFSSMPTVTLKQDMNHVLSPTGGLQKFSSQKTLFFDVSFLDRFLQSVSSLLHLRKTLSVALPQTHTGNAPSKLHIINRVSQSLIYFKVYLPTFWSTCMVALYFSVHPQNFSQYVVSPMMHDAKALHAGCRNRGR